jgi:hypothetical protein
MKQITALSTIILFFVWILPLGVFIRPSQEKLACGGRRAVCLCSHMDPQSKAKPAQGCSLQANPNANEEANASANGPGQYYLAAYLSSQEILNTFILHESLASPYHTPSLDPIEHVPKHPATP